MASKVFISFRFSDGNEKKKELERLLESKSYAINVSESIDRSHQTEDTIKRYLYERIADSTVTIVILTPEAIRHRRDYYGRVDDWMYDELRYSLEDRSYNKASGAIAVYTSGAEYSIKNGSTILDFDNLARKNMFNIKSSYKKCPDYGQYNALEDHYISLVSWSDFVADPKKYIDNALSKRDRINEFDITKRMS
jgi:hypothetical protein